MTTVVNPYAAGGRARDRWNLVSSLLPRRPGRNEIRMIGPGSTVSDAVRDAIQAGEREFTAAGGDGTINALVNALASMLGPEELRNVAVGALGLGSSNDFHKPSEQSIRGFPARIDFDRARPRDAGCLTFDSCRRFFLVNASAGVTADANAFFNGPDRGLRLLKSVSTAAAISYAALRTIAAHEPVTASVASDGVEVSGVGLSNLAILQSPYVSGSLRFPEAASPGRFSIYLHAALGRRELVRLLMALRRGACTLSGRSLHWSAPFLSVAAARPFTVEYDGETVQTASARCHVCPHFLRICP